MGQHLWARGYWVVSSGNVTDEMLAEYIKNQVPPEPGQLQCDVSSLPVRPRADPSGFKP
nr:transposase [Mesorhizobium sangaii]